MTENVMINLSIDELKDIIREAITESKSEKTAPETMYYTRQQVAELLHVTLQTVHNLVNSGCLTAKKVGSRTLFDSSEVEKAISEKKILRYGRRN